MIIYHNDAMKNEIENNEYVITLLRQLNDCLRDDMTLRVDEFYFDNVDNVIDQMSVTINDVLSFTIT